MKLEAVWFKDNREVFQVDPVMNIVCNEDMKDISEVEVYDGHDWYSCESFSFDEEADSFTIRIKRE